MNPVIVIVESDADHLALLTAQMERGRRFATKGFTRADEALEEIRTDPPDAVVCELDAAVTGRGALTLRIRELSPALPIIIITPRGSEPEAEGALQMGATDFVTRPVDPKTLETRLRRALEQVPAQELLTSVTAIRFDRHGLVGQHPLVQGVRDFVDQVAATAHVSALLLGESGTGKNMVARAIHGASDQAHRRFVEVNCAALPPHLLEAELFGHERGAGGRQSKKGLAEVADGGTLFLDEVAALSPELQVRLLAFMERRSFQRIGSAREVPVSVRLIAATNTDLAEAVRTGRFREDLYRRLTLAAQLLPPLRAIRSDIPELASHFVKRAAEYFAKPLPMLEAAGLERLQQHDWPGNARELRNVVERAMIFSTGRTLQAFNLQPSAPASTPAVISIPRGLTLDEVERLYIESSLRDQGGSVEGTARQLGISRKVLWQRRRKHGMSSPRGD